VSLGILSAFKSPRQRYLIRPSRLLSVVLTTGLFSIAHAQVTTRITADGTLGTTVTPSGNLYNINGGTIKGTNQFHSFGQFSVGTGDIASFNGPAGIQNILSRVTGGNISEIDGTLRSTISGANLFLMNPSGILFGPNAQLDVGGSFHATTANYIGLADGTRFNAIASADGPLLTAAPPAAFGFLTSNPAPIDVDTANLLHVPVGQTISFVGGAVNVGAPDGSIPGYVLAPAGRVNLISVASSGEAAFDGTGFNVDRFAQLGEASIRGGSIVDGKEVFIRSGRLVIDESLIMPGAFAFLGLPVPPPDGGEVNIKVTNDVTITGTAPEPFTQAPPGILVFNGAFDSIAPAAKVPDVRIDAGSLSVAGFSSIQTDRLGPGDPGNITMNAPTVRVSNGGSIGLFNFFAGSGGDLTINAQEVDLVGGPSPLPTGLAAQGTFHPGYFKFSIDPALTFADSGNITVNASNTLSITGGAAISTESTAFGRGGDIILNAGNILLAGTGQAEGSGVISAQSLLGGDAGNISITASGHIEIQDAFRITANTGGSGNGGTVKLVAGDSITMTGANSRILSGTAQPPNETLNALFLNVYGISFDDLRTNIIGDPNASLMQVLAFLNSIGFTALPDLTPGNGGTISITTPVLTMNADTRIEASTGWEGNAGAIVANLNSLFLNDGASIRNRSGIQLLTGDFAIGTGNAGTVNITAADTISVSGRSPTSGTGSAITTSTLGDGNGGDVSLSAGKSVGIVNGGLVSADSLGGTGLAGNINITAGNQIVMTDGSVSTRAVTADGGNITLNAPNLIQLTDSQVTTSVESGVGTGGNITIDPQALILNNSQILANAFGGPGGNINIVADVFLVNNNGQLPTSLAGIVDASSALSTPGTINIEATFTNVTSEVVQLPETPLKATELLRAACAARFVGGKTSSLVLAGRDGLPPQPGGLLPSPLYLAGKDAPATARINGFDPSRYSLFGQGTDQYRYSLLPNFKCS
jgi:filamentous hemagglutinin family protein